MQQCKWIITQTWTSIVIMWEKHISWQNWILEIHTAGLFINDHAEKVGRRGMGQQFVIPCPGQMAYWEGKQWSSNSIDSYRNFSTLCIKCSAEDTTVSESAPGQPSEACGPRYWYRSCSSFNRNFINIR